jgi:AcrR family transcriptional regulator
VTARRVAVGEHRPVRGRRSDAVRNAEKVFAAALEVCAERGVTAGLPEVAARAGVGRTTVYRSFTSRDELIAAVMEFKLRTLSERMAVATRREDAWEGLRDLLVMVMGDVREDRLLGDALLLRPDLFPPESAAVAQVNALLERGQEQGVIDPDIRGSDLSLMVSGVASSLAASDQRSPAAWTRAAEFIANSARAAGGSERATSTPPSRRKDTTSQRR